MWSGPRNISTAMMRSWGSRDDCAVSDEPLYAHYLSTLDEPRRREHPVFDEVMRSQPLEWRAVAARLTGPVPGRKPVWYQKHMAHHLTERMGLGWVDGLTNCFLIREPAAMITSFVRVIENPRPRDLGLPQQAALFERVRERTGRVPVVIDSRDVLMNPGAMLAKLCAAVGVAFDEAMLRWDAGPRETDGVWAPHWYASVHASTGFAPYVEKNEAVPARLNGVLAECEGLYAVLAEHRIRLESE